MTSLLFVGGSSSYGKQLVAPHFNALFDAATIPGSSAVYGADYSPDGKYLALCYYGGSKYIVIDLSTGNPVPGVPSIINTGRGAAFSGDSSLLAIAHDSGDRLVVINTGDWSTVSGTPTPPGEPENCTFSPDGAFLAVSHRSTGRLVVYETTGWAVVGSTPTFTDTIYDIQFSPNSAYLAVGYRNGDGLAIIDVATWTLVAGTPVLPSYQQGNGVSFSPDGTRLAVAHNYGNGATIINTSDWSVVSTPSLNLSGNGQGCSYSYDGALLAFTIDSGNGLKIYETATYTELSGVVAIPTGKGKCVFSPQKAIPSRKMKTLGPTGNPTSKTLRAVDPETQSLIVELVSDPGTGEATAYALYEKTVWVGVVGGSTVTPSDVAAFKLDDSSDLLPPFVFVEAYSGALVTISSNLTTQAGAAGDEVVIRDWGTRKLVAKVTPDAAGDWSAAVPPGTYDVSYLADGCAPVIHGPYTIELPTP